MAIEENVRVDKWLWAARFFKTRSLASKAVSGGHVHVNGQRIKPSRSVRVGDKLQIKRGMVEFDVVVHGLSERRGPAPDARELYQETEESVRRREETAEQRRILRMTTTAPSRKPDKRDRRKIRKFTRKD